jgi:membrane protease YdiL (CAAX protease family)
VGLEYVVWNLTSPLSIVRAVVLGLLAGSAIAWLFRNYEMGVQPPFTELWIAVTWGPLIEEVVFRGYLFSFLDRLLKLWSRSPGWLVVITIAAAFAAGHLIKARITPIQIATVFPQARSMVGCCV